MIVTLNMAHHHHACGFSDMLIPNNCRHQGFYIKLTNYLHRQQPDQDRNQ